MAAGVTAAQGDQDVVGHQAAMHESGLGQGMGALAALEGARIGILENGKLNAEEMLREVADLFVQRHGCTVRTLASKRNASAPAPGNTLVKIAPDVDFLITGLGD